MQTGLKEHCKTIFMEEFFVYFENVDTTTNISHPLMADGPEGRITTSTRNIRYGELQCHSLCSSLQKYSSLIVVDFRSHQNLQQTPHPLIPGQQLQQNLQRAGLRLCLLVYGICVKDKRHEEHLQLQHHLSLICFSLNELNVFR